MLSSGLHRDMAAPLGFGRELLRHAVHQGYPGGRSKAGLGVTACAFDPSTGEAEADSHL